LIEVYQKSAVFAVVRNFSVVDWAAVLAVFFGVAWGSRKGASEMFGKTGGMILIGVIVLSCFNHLAATFMGIVPSLLEAVARPMAFFLLSIFVWLSVSWSINVLGKFFHVEAHGVLKTFGGALLGVVFFLLLLSLIAQFLLLFPSKGIQKVFSEGRSFSGATIARIFPRVREIVAAPFRTDRPRDERGLNRAK